MKRRPQRSSRKGFLARIGGLFTGESLSPRLAPIAPRGRAARRHLRFETLETRVLLTNSPPVAMDSTESVIHDRDLPAYVNAYDVDPDQLTYSVVSAPANGTLDTSSFANSGSYTYTPNPLYKGQDSFTYSVFDGTDWDTGEVTINVTNEAPVPTNGNESTLHDQALNSYLNAYDVDGDNLEFTLAPGPYQGTIVVETGGSFTYTPLPGQVYDETFTFTVTDDVDTETGTFTVHVTNTAPDATNGSGTTNQNESYFDYVTAYDVDGDALNYAIVSNPANGTVTLNDPLSGSFTYTPNSGFIGADSFTFTASDGIASDTGTYSVSVACPPTSGSGSGSSTIAEGAPVGTTVHTVPPAGLGASTFSIVAGNSSGYFAVDSSGNVVVNSLILVSEEEQHSLEIVAADQCGSYVYYLDVTVLPVLIDIYPAEDPESFAFQLDSYVGSASSLETFWLVPASYLIDVTLPAIASPSDYEVELWDGTILSLSSTTQTFQVDYLPPAAGGVMDLLASVVLAADPTVQAAQDNQQDDFSKWTKDINAQIKTWIGNMAESGFDSVLKNAISEPFEMVKSEVNNTIGQLDPVDDLAKIDALKDFRDNRLPGLQDQAASDIKSLVLDTVMQMGNVTVRNGGGARQALDDANSIDTSQAERFFDIDPVVKFQITQEMKDALLQANTSLIEDELKQPHKLFSEIGIEVKHVFDTESFVTGRLTVSNLDPDIEKCTFKGKIDVFNVQVGGNRVNFGISQEYTPATDNAQATIHLEVTPP